jgi:hypothetical protein
MPSSNLITIIQKYQTRGRFEVFWYVTQCTPYKFTKKLRELAVFIFRFKRSRVVKKWGHQISPKRRRTSTMLHDLQHFLCLFRVSTACLFPPTLNLKKGMKQIMVLPVSSPLREISAALLSASVIQTRHVETRESKTSPPLPTPSYPLMTDG